MKWLKRLALPALLATLVVVATVFILLRASIAPTTGEFPVTGLSAPVQIVFDDYQRPYVTAETIEDAFFAEGWLHASHRLFQMELFRRAGTGRLSELLGAGMLDSDEELWRIGVPQLAKQLEQNAKSEMHAYVERYVAGVNAGIDAMRVRPPEFLLMMTRPQPWTPSDVYAMGALMAFQSANNSGNELLRLALFEELGSERAAIFLTADGAREGFPYVMPTALRTSKLGALGVLDRLAAIDPTDTALFPSFAFGSNGWVVAPQRSETGRALFAFDSHDDFGIPNLFYEVHLFFGEGRHIRGWSVAGLPGVINGYNEQISWGFTNIGDTQDLFIETRSEENPTLFKDGDTWYEARQEIVEIPVRGRDEPHRLTILHTLNGPLISDDPPIALQWTVRHLDGAGLDSLLAFNLARNWEEYTAALDAFPAPSLNATYADADGNIGFRTGGLIPIRGAGEGLVPLAGDDPANRWQGFVPANEMPEQLNPPEGFLAAANARVNPAGEGPLISADNAPGYRIRRIRDVLTSKEKFTLDDMRVLQRDWYDQQAALLMPTMLDAIADHDAEPLEQAARNELRSWQDDYRAEPDRAAPIIFQAWYRALTRQVFEPELSPDLFKRLFKANYPLNHALDRLILDEPESDWWRGSRNEVIHAALRNAVDELREAMGADVSGWRLDQVHAVKQEHELAKAVPPLAAFFNLPPAPWGGSATTVGRARYRYDRAYDSTAGATVRVTGEMTDPPTMQAVIPTGQSGHPLSPHYGNQQPAWLAGDQFPIAPTPDQVQAPTLTLLPND